MYTTTRASDTVPRGRDFDAVETFSVQSGASTPARAQVSALTEATPYWVSCKAMSGYGVAQSSVSVRDTVVQTRTLKKIPEAARQLSVVALSTTALTVSAAFRAPANGMAKHGTQWAQR